MENQTRVTLKREYSNAKEVILEIDKLTNEFKAVHKRNSEVELFLSELGTLKKSTFELTAYFNGKDAQAIKDVEFFEKQVNPMLEII